MLCRAGGGGAGLIAKDALGNDVKATEWLKTHGANDRNLVQGLKVGQHFQFNVSWRTPCFCCSTEPTQHDVVQADATYLIVTENKEIEKYGLNAVCTHLGCVVPWNSVSVVFAHSAVVQLHICELCCNSKLVSLCMHMQNENKFKCPCHGSQYNKEGKKVRGPAPLVRCVV